MHTDTCKTYTHHTYIPRLPTRTHILAPSFAFNVHVIAGLLFHKCFDHALFSSCHRRKSFQKFTPINAVMYYSYFYCERRLRKSLKNNPKKSSHRFSQRRLSSPRFALSLLLYRLVYLYRISISSNAACGSWHLSLINLYDRNKIRETI